MPVRKVSTNLKNKLDKVSAPHHGVVVGGTNFFPVETWALLYFKFSWLKKIPPPILFFNTLSFYFIVKKIPTPNKLS